MIELRFEISELDSVRKKSLQAILFVLLLESECKIEVSPVEFPDKFQFGIYAGLNNNCGFVLVWDDEKSGFYFLKKSFETVLSRFLSDEGTKMLSKLLVR